jgi:starch synthase
MSKVLIATPELAELAPVGGIAEYVFGLASALLEKGHDVRVVLPLYDFLAAQPDKKLLKERLVIRLGPGASEATPVYTRDLELQEGSDRKLPVVLLGSHKHFATVRQPGEIYNWPDHHPWIVFSRGVVDWLLSEDDWQPDVIHCQDAHTALIPVFIRQLRSREVPFASRVKTVLTIHNLLNQGAGPRDLVTFAGLPDECFDQLFEYYGMSNCFKAGLLTADAVNTVSRTYAEEICETSDFGFGLEGVLRMRRDGGKLRGILNGIDEDRWMMEGLRYDGSDSAETVARSKHNVKQTIFSQWEWQNPGEPVIAFRGRWDEQKGVALLVAALSAMAEMAQIVIVTWGKPDATPRLKQLWKALGAMEEANPGRIKVNPKVLSTLDGTKMHYAIADFFLMPSRYEPAGLTQQECQRFGTIPIVRKTGGLADTVAEEQITDFPSPNGYVFSDFHPSAMLEAVKRAVGDFADLTKRSALIANTLRQRNGWESRLADYEDLYR